MSDIDDDLESQDALSDDDASDETQQTEGEREKIFAEWQAFDCWDNCLDGIFDGRYLTDVWRLTHKPMRVKIHGDLRTLYLEPKHDEIKELFASPDFEPFKVQWEAHQKTATRTLQKLARVEGQRRGVSFDAIQRTDRPRYLIPGIIPASGITFAYGPSAAGKSALLHRIALTVADDDATFDGLPVTHGRVLYLSLDPGGDKETVKFDRMLPICERFKIKPPSANRLILIDSPATFIDRPEKVAELLDKNPGPFALVVIDSLYRALSTGDPVQASQVNPAIDGMMQIAEETGAAICVSTHSGRGDDKHMLGTIFQDAGASAIWRVARDHKSGKVTLDCEKLKNDKEPDKALLYKLDKSCLVSMNDVADLVSSAADTVKRADMLALIPPKPGLPIRDARKKIEHLLRSKEADARRKEWERIREAWDDAGVAKQEDGRIWRVTP
jgi:hypothetical protein